MDQVFISYARQDKKYARAIKERLIAEGINAFWDIDLQTDATGAPWRDDLRDAIRASACMVVVVTSEAHAMIRPNVIWEWALMDARGNKSIIIPLAFECDFIKLGQKIEDNEKREFVLESRLKDFTAHSFRGLDDESAWGTLLKKLRKITIKYSRDPQVEETAQDLYSHDREQRRKAQDFLIEYESSEAEQALVDAMGNPSPDVDIEAAFALLKRNPKNNSAIASLERALRRYNPEHYHFGNAAKQIGEMNTDESIAKLREIIWDENFRRDKRIKFVETALYYCHHPSTPVLLRDLFNDLETLQIEDENMLITLARTIGAVSAEEALPALIVKLDGLLPKENSGSIIAIAEAMARIGNPEALDSLERALLRCRLPLTFRHYQEIVNDVHPIYGTEHDHKSLAAARDALNNMRVDLLVASAHAIMDALLAFGDAGEKIFYRHSNDSSLAHHYGHYWNTRHQL